MAQAAPPLHPWPCPALRLWCDRDPTGRITHTYAQRAQADFLYGRGPQKWRGLSSMLATMWPDDFCARVEMDGERGPGPHFHMSNKWNPWLVRILRACVNEEHAVRQGESVFRFVGLTGCATAGKTFATGLYAVAWWCVDPANSIVILTSTTKDMVRDRVWNVVRHFATSMRDLESGQPIALGRLVDSQMKITAHGGEEGTNPACIKAYAVAHGETLKAVDNLKGMHARRMLVVIDEANSTPEAIFEVLPNYRKACQDLTVIIIGNPATRLDPHGRAMQPVAGWGAFNEDLVEWPTRPVLDWHLEGGVALRFDGRDSPNVKARANRYRYIYTWDDWQQAVRHEGTFGYWTMDRGMWPPEGFANTVFTEQLLARCLDEQPFVFDSAFEWLAFLDPAFGGDACVLQFARLGVSGGRNVLQLADWLEVPIDPNAASHDIDYQIARRVQQECVVRRVKPACFGLDATGIGRGVGAILAAEWSPQIAYMNWGQSATERASAQNNARPAREVYTTFVGEMWFAMREFVEAGQVRGVPREAVAQFCSRLWSQVGKKMRLEPKDEMRARLRYSPDCFVAGTLVETLYGPRPIESIASGDLVLTPFGYSCVLLTHHTRTRQLVAVTFSDGTSLRGKGAHEIYTTMGWCRLDTLSCCHELESVVGMWRWKLLNTLFTRVASTGFSHLADTIRTGTRRAPSAYFIVSFGSSIMALSRTAWSFITAMTTGATTGLRTWSLWRTGTTPAATGMLLSKILAWPQAVLLAWRRLASLRPHGTRLQPVWSGIGSTGMTRGTELGAVLSPRRAIVGSSSSPSSPTQDASALISAMSARESRVRVSLASAWFAATSFLRWWRSAPKRVVHRAVIGCEPASVYNLTLLSENAYYANGVLVRNCADACVGALEVARRLGLDLDGKIAQAVTVDWRKAQRDAEGDLADSAPASAHGETGWAEAVNAESGTEREGAPVYAGGWD